MIPQVELQWSSASPEQATWEDLEALHQQFPFTSAWGQADIQGKGIVNGPEATTTSQGNKKDSGPNINRPRRESEAWPS
jgi:hypothetical protein